MYQQIKPTEVFRERQLALLKEAENRRLVGLRVGTGRTLTKARSAIATAVVSFVAALVFAGLMLAASSSPAHASTTFTVDNIGDPGDGLCNAQGCTLRDAILAANSTPNSGGPDLINFNIPGTGVKTIRLSSVVLPAITDPVVIDGYTQGASTPDPADDAKPNTLAKGTNAKLLIELDGSGARSTGSGLLNVQASNTVVRGLVINRFDGRGIQISGTKGVKIEGNFIGTDPSGTKALGNDTGVAISSGSGNIVGGSVPEARNLISGNDFTGGAGVNVLANNPVTSANKVLGNLIGTSKDGISPLGNSGDGVQIVRSTNTVVGGATSGSANTIAFNGSDGVEVSGDDATTANRVLRNSIFRNSQSVFNTGGLGINLGLGGIDSNDPLDADVGPNGLQNFPVITSAKTISGLTTIKGRLTTKANKSFVVRFFKNPSGKEGKTFIGQKKVSAGKDGKVSFTFSPAQKVGVGKTVTATATGSEGTSEFSAPRTVASS